MTNYKLAPMEPTDGMVIRGAEDIFDTFRQYGIEILDDMHNATEIEQQIAESCFTAMLAAAPEVEQEPAAWMTHHAIPMLFLTESEAAAYCDDDEQPVPLYMHRQPAQVAEYPPCDYCGVTPDHHPWHGSGHFNGVDNPHIHACNGCRHLLPAVVALPS